MTKYSFALRAALLTSATLASATLLPGVAYAAPDQTPPDANTIIVTGSAIPTAPDAIAVPVSIVNAEAIAKSGVSTNVLEILRKAIPAFGGRNSTGNSNATNNNQRTAGGSSIQLRNLDTLVLVNGRRIAPDAISGVNGKVFVNVSEIPPDAIDHIEVLTDGASAIYGSDAIGGVVNIILKSNWTGAQVNVRYGGADGYNERSAGMTYGFNPFKGTNLTLSASYSKSDPLYQNQRAFSSPFYSTGTGVPGATGSFGLAPGISSPALNGGYANAAADPQYVNYGATTPTAPGTGIGGTYDLSRFNTILLQQEQKAVSASLTSELSDDHSIDLFADAEFAQNDNYTRFLPVTMGLTVPAGAPYNPFTNNTSVTFASTSNPATYTTRENSFRGTIGLKGQVPALGRGGNWEFAYTHSENTINQTVANIIYKPNAIAAVKGGFNSACVATAGGGFSQVTSLTGGGLICQPALDPFSVGSAVSPAALANVLTNELIHGRSALDTVDGKVVGSLFHLPGGAIQFAVGGSWRREAVSGTVDPTNYVHVDGTTATATQSLTQGGLNVDPFSAHRTITAQFLELRLPITGADRHVTGLYNFDIVAAVRHEHYSGVGDSTVPKVGFRWQPVARQLTIRGDYARSFTAPSLYALGGPLNFRTSQGPIGTSGLSSLNYTFNAEDGNNPNVKPAHADSYTLGVVFKPDAVPHLKIDAEYNSVIVKGSPGGIGFNNILIDVNANGSASPFYNNIALGNFPGLAGASNASFATPGALATYLTNPANATSASTFGNLYIVDRFTNLGETRIKSLNFTTSYDYETHDMGTISFMNQAAVLLSYKYRALPVTASGTNPAQVLYDFTGTTTQGGGSQGTLPRLRMYTSVDWSWNAWSLGIANTYIGGVNDIGAGGAGFFTQYNAGNPQYIIGKVKSFSSWDLRASWGSAAEPGARGLTVAVGVNNLFNQAPPVSSNINPAAGANAGAVAWRAENNTDVSTYGAIQRLIYVSAGLRF